MMMFLIPLVTPINFDENTEFMQQKMCDAPLALQIIFGIMFCALLVLALLVAYGIYKSFTT